MGNSYRSKVDEWLKPDKLELLNCWARDYSLTDICAKMDISHKTLIEWREKYPEIDEAIRSGKEIVDYKVENALLKVALGFTTTEVKTYIGYPDKQGNRKTRTETTVKEIPPNPTAIMCWLNNRKPEQWKRNRDTFQTETKDNNIVVNIIRKDTAKDEEWEVAETTQSESNIKKSKSKKAEPINDLDYWPDDWSDD